MKFIELSGKTLYRLLQPDEIDPEELRKAGVSEDSLVRINPQGDIEVRKTRSWEVIGGLLGDFSERVKRATGRDWA
ncbi:MAG: hypothetical protein K1X74_16470 [Pirellulales bacterium]|nr:hypothetical protein [Pirellulales bacterium]